MFLPLELQVLILSYLDGVTSIDLVSSDPYFLMIVKEHLRSSIIDSIVKSSLREQELKNLTTKLDYPLDNIYHLRYPTWSNDVRDIRSSGNRLSIHRIASIDDRPFQRFVIRQLLEDAHTYSSESILRLYLEFFPRTSYFDQHQVSHISFLDYLLAASGRDAASHLIRHNITVFVPPPIYHYLIPRLGRRIRRRFRLQITERLTRPTNGISPYQAEYDAIIAKLR